MINKQSTQDIKGPGEQIRHLLEWFRLAFKQHILLNLMLGLVLLLSTAGFILSLRFLKVVYTKVPVEIYCNKDDLEKMDRAGETLRQLIKK